MEQARREFDAQGPLANEDVEAEKWWRKSLEGEITLSAGDTNHAAAAFSDGQPSGKMWFDTSQPIEARRAIARLRTSAPPSCRIECRVGDPHRQRHRSAAIS